MFGHYPQGMQVLWTEGLHPPNSHVEILTLSWVKTAGLLDPSAKPQSYLTVNICYLLDIGRGTPRWLRDHPSGPWRGQSRMASTLVSKGRPMPSRAGRRVCWSLGIQPRLGKLRGQTAAPGGSGRRASSPGGLFSNPEISACLPKFWPRICPPPSFLPVSSLGLAVSALRLAGSRIL